MGRKQLRTEFGRSIAGVLAGGLAASVLFGAVPAFAEEQGAVQVPYGFVQTENGVMWSNGDGTFKQNEWYETDGRMYFYNADGYILTGFQTIGGKRFYLPADGIFSAGWKVIDGNFYYIRPEDATIAVSTTVDGYTVDEEGKLIPAEGTVLPEAEIISLGAAAAAVPDATEDTAAKETPAATAPVSAFEQQVQSIIASCTSSSMTSAQKLRACYNWVINNASYKRTYETPSGDWTKAYAADIYNTGKGNCYRYAAAFAYLAKELGYNVTLCTGTISAARGGVTPHAWVVIRIGGTDYIYDTEMADAKGAPNSYYQKTFAQYPVKPLNRLHDWAISF